MNKNDSKSEGSGLLTMNLELTSVLNPEVRISCLNSIRQSNAEIAITFKICG